MQIYDMKELIDYIKWLMYDDRVKYRACVFDGWVRLVDGIVDRS